MATFSNFVNRNEEKAPIRNTPLQQKIYLHRLLNLRRSRAIHSNRGVVTVFAIMCCFIVMMTYLETSRMLIPTKVVSERDLRSLTSGFTNDLPNTGSQDDPAMSQSFTPHPHRPKAMFIGFSQCGGRSILNILATHPDVTVNRRELKHLIGNTKRKGFLSHMPPLLNRHVTIDVCWTCVTNRTALNNIKSLRQTTKIVLVVCDPVYRLLKRYANRNGSQEKVSSNHIKSRLASYDIDSLKTKILVKFSLLNNLEAQLLTENGDYFRHIVDLYDIFSRQQVLIIERERFRKNFISELSRLHKFLGVPLQSEIRGINYDMVKEVMCYSFNSVIETCQMVRPENLTHIFGSEGSLLNSLKQFYKPFNRRLFLYLDLKYNWI